MINKKKVKFKVNYVIEMKVFHWKKAKLKRETKKMEN